MRFLLLICCLCSFIHFANAQNQNPISLGIGFVISTNPYKFEDSSHSNQIYEDQKLTKKVTENIFPFFYKPDYGLYHFICLEKTDSYYQILVNNSQIAFIPNNQSFMFSTWESILLGTNIAQKDKK